jgi:hypothetical protein
MTIVDWKTSFKPAPRSLIMARMQTKVYPLLVVDAGRNLFGGTPVLPEQVEMIYWFTNAPDQAVHFQYSQQQYQADYAALENTISEITHCRPGQFAMTLNERNCAYCVYRSLCNRGVGAGRLEEMDWDEEAGLANQVSFDQIAEVEF